jgi:hypothetical protein
MNSKAVAIFVLVILTLSSIAMIQIMPVNAVGGSSNTLTLSDVELGTQFAYEVGPATLTAITDIPGTGVQFDFTGLNPSVGTVVGDNFPVSQLAGGAWKTYGVTNPFSTWGDFSAYKRYSLCFKNVGTEPVTVNLKMNTGWTIPPPEYAAIWRDTFWQNDWIYIGVGQCVVVTLDFSSAEVYNALDELEFTQYPDGTRDVAVWRTDEASDIGFQVLGNGAGSIVVIGTQLYIDPPVVNKAPGGADFTVAVTLENFVNLAGFDIKLTWNSALITETGVDYTTYLNALWGTGKWSVVFEQSGVGFYELAVVALATSASNLGASVLFNKTFHVDRSCNFPLSTPIHFDMVNLSDNGVPVPKSICAVVTDGMYYMSATKPDLEFKVKKLDKKTGEWAYINSPYEFEYCDWIEVEIWVTHICICSCLTDYNMKIQYDPDLIRFDKVDYWGIFGVGTVGGTSGLVQVSGEGNPWSGSEGLLFALTFHVEFGCSPEHIWKYGNLNYERFNIEIVEAELSFGGISTLTLSDVELGTQFAYEVGPATLTAITDIPGTGVQFDFTGLNPSVGTVVGDNFPVNALAGGAYKDYGYGFAGPYDFSGYKRYCVCICNVGPNPITVALKMNTGWTVDWSGGLWKGPDGYGASMARDTYWQSDLVNIGTGECKVVTLDFSSATVYNAMDDPNSTWQVPDGTTGVTVRRLDEVSDIGFQVWGNGAGSIVVKGCMVGFIGMEEIIMPLPLTIQVNFIRGDVDCDGDVDTFDISSVAYYYNKPASAKPEYDLNNDGTINVFDLVTIATNYGYGLDP